MKADRPKVPEHVKGAVPQESHPDGEGLISKRSVDSTAFSIEWVVNEYPQTHRVFKKTFLAPQRKEKLLDTHLLWIGSRIRRLFSYKLTIILKRMYDLERTKHAERGGAKQHTQKNRAVGQPSTRTWQRSARRDFRMAI